MNDVHDIARHERMKNEPTVAVLLGNEAM